MKNWLVAAIVTGIVMLPVVAKKKKLQTRPAPIPPSDTDKRYNIEEFVGGEVFSQRD